MPAPISVIIPTLNAAAGLPGCFASLMDGLDADMIREVVVVDAGSSDATLTIADGWGADIITVAAPSRGAQLRAGADAARGDYLLFLHADTQLSPGWPLALGDPLPPGPACFRLAFRSRHPMAAVTAAWANLRTRLFGLPYGDQGLLVSRRDYAAAGGFPNQPLMEDVALARALPPITLLAATARTGADRYERDGWLRRGTKNLTLLTRYLLGADPAALVKRY